MNYVIDEKLWDFDDPRVDDLWSGKMSLVGFVRRTTPADPWRGSTQKDVGCGAVFYLRVYSELELQNIREDAMRRHRENLAVTGGLNANQVWDNRELFMTVYPEISEEIKRIEARVASDECTACAINRELVKAVQIILGSTRLDRDFHLLLGRLPELCIRRLRLASPLRPDDIEIYHVATWTIPAMRKTKRDGLPNVVFQFTDEISKEAKTARNPTEPPCLECAEKHIAVVRVLLQESFNGYRNSLKIIGNLELAEEHSMFWPKLHDEIRKIRKAWKTAKPDWDKIEDIIESIRRNPSTPSRT